MWVAKWAKKGLKELVELVYRDLGQMVAARRERGRHWRQIGVCADLQDQIHSDHNVIEEVTMEQPESCVGQTNRPKGGTHG